MKNRLLNVVRVGFIAVIAMTLPAMAQDTTPDNQIVAVVNGEPVFMSEVMTAAAGLPEQYRDAPIAALYPHLLERVVSMRLLAAEGTRLELDQTDAFELQMEQVREQLLEQVLLNQVVDEAITDELLQERYQTFLAEQPSGEEIRARHILLADEEGAKGVITMLEEGGDFAELAKSHSTGPSGPQGGDLGYFAKGQMVPAFEEAIFALETGTFTPVPVQTQFGWHVIYLEDRRDKPKPELAQVEEQLRAEMARDIEVDYVKSMVAKATVERFNMDGSVLDGAPQ